MGCNQVERARKGITRALILALIVTAVVMMPVMAFAPQIVRFFNRKAEVVEYGTMLIRWISPFYMLCCFTQIYSAAQRGVGNSKVPMAIMLVSFVAFRQLYLFVMSRVWNEILPIAMGYPAGWILSSSLSTLYYHTHKSKLDQYRLIEDK